VDGSGSPVRSYNANRPGAPQNCVSSPTQGISHASPPTGAPSAESPHQHSSPYSTPAKAVVKYPAHRAGVMFGSARLLGKMRTEPVSFAHPRAVQPTPGARNDASSADKIGAVVLHLGGASVEGYIRLQPSGAKGQPEVGSRTREGRARSLSSSLGSASERIADCDVLSDVSRSTKRDCAEAAEQDAMLGDRGRGCRSSNRHGRRALQNQEQSNGYAALTNPGLHHRHGQDR